MTRRLTVEWPDLRPFVSRDGAAIRLLEPPIDLPPITQMLWWHSRLNTDPAHAWLRRRLTTLARRLGPPKGVSQAAREDSAPQCGHHEVFFAHRTVRP